MHTITPHSLMFIYLVFFFFFYYPKTNNDNSNNNNETNNVNENIDTSFIEITIFLGYIREHTSMLKVPRKNIHVQKDGLDH